MTDIAVVLGSKSDISHWENAQKYAEYFGLRTKLKILSAHRSPDQVAEFARSARREGYQIIIAAAGMAAHLAGALAAHTDLPVLGVPLPGGVIDGLDALLATVQMPAGVPVATFAVGTAGMRNACVFAAEILSLNNPELVKRLQDFKKQGSRL
jgi:phosphoribosylaminoimidazole carboxylase PurE protein